MSFRWSILFHVPLCIILFQVLKHWFTDTWSACTSCSIFNCWLWCTADDVGRRLTENVPVFHQHSAITTVQSSDVGNVALLAENAVRPLLDHHWQRQQLMQMRSEMSDVNSRIAHLSILMDLARSVCWRLIVMYSMLMLLICSHEMNKCVYPHNADGRNVH